MAKEKQLPEKFEERLKQQLGNEYEDFLEALNEYPVTSLRLNPNKITNSFDNEDVVPWFPQGRYLEKRPSFAADPHIFAGGYYVQEASSMFLGHVMQQVLSLSETLNVLDLCAAPGGKSTLMLSLLSQESLLITNELMKNRLPSLVENLTRWGNANQIVTSGGAVQFQAMPNFFDALVIDAPCSGEGMFRKDPKAINMWSEGLVHSCSMTQRQILAEVLPSLKEGGYLIYSTCTFAPQENEEILQWLAEKEVVESIRISLDDSWGIKEEKVIVENTPFYGYRFYPHKVKGEGFFMACLRKVGNTSPSKKSKKQKKGKSAPKLQELPKKYTDELAKWITNPEAFTFFIDGEIVRVLPKQQKFNANLANAALPYKRIGLALGKFRKGKLTPAHSLAVSPLIADSVPRMNLNYEQAIKYLRKDELPIEETRADNLKGWVLMCYEYLALGWAKLLPNRLNNYYPTEMRLRKEV